MKATTRQTLSMGYFINISQANPNNTEDILQMNALVKVENDMRILFVLCGAKAFSEVTFIISEVTLRNHDT